MTEIIIAGGGVAGSYLALKLTEAGFKVIVFDPQKRYKKACGESIPNDSLPAMLSKEMNLDLNYINEFKILVNGMPAKSLEFKKPLWKIIDKWGLVNELRSLSKDQGAKYLYTTVNPKKINKKEGLVIDSRGPYSNKDFIVALRVIAKIPWKENLALIDFQPNKGGLYWIFPHKKDVVNAGGGFIKANIKSTTNYIINYLKKVAQDKNIDIIDIRAAPIAITRRIIFHDNNIVKIGEAAGLINSTSGEGIRHALLSSYKLYETLVHCNEDYKCIARKYKQGLKEIKREVLLSRKMFYIALKNPDNLRELFSALPESFWNNYLSGKINSSLLLTKNIASINVLRTLGFKNLLNLLY